MNRNAQACPKRLEIVVGSRVLIRKDFDTNAQTKRDKFGSFFNEEQFEVLEILANNSVLIKGLTTGQRLAMCKSRLKVVYYEP